VLRHRRRAQIQRPRGGEDAAGAADRAQHEQAMGIDPHSVKLNHKSHQSQFQTRPNVATIMGMVTMLIGFAGGLAVLLSFAGVASGRLSAHGAAYHAMNLAGAVAMVAAGLPADAWPSVVVNVSWALISAFGLVRAVTPPRPAREPLTEEHSVPAL
jgi:hypothetical protein